VRRLPGEDAAAALLLEGLSEAESAQQRPARLRNRLRPRDHHRLERAALHLRFAARAEEVQLRVRHPARRLRFETRGSHRGGAPAVRQYVQSEPGGPRRPRNRVREMRTAVAQIRKVGVPCLELPMDKWAFLEMDFQSDWGKALRIAEVQNSFAGFPCRNLESSSVNQIARLVPEIGENCKSLK